jgi:hypothetical protein
MMRGSSDWPWFGQTADPAIELLFLKIPFASSPSLFSIPSSNLPIHLNTSAKHPLQQSTTCPELSRSVVVSRRSVPVTTFTKLAVTLKVLRRGSKVP